MCCALANTSPRISENRGPKIIGVVGQRRRQRVEMEEFVRGIQADIRTEGQSPQHAEYLYFTSDMYSNREAEERHSREVAKSLQMTNG